MTPDPDTKPPPDPACWGDRVPAELLFLRALRAAPADPAVRAAYIDWLEGRGRQTEVALHCCTWSADWYGRDGGVPGFPHGTVTGYAAAGWPAALTAGGGLLPESNDPHLRPVVYGLYLAFADHPSEPARHGVFVHAGRAERGRMVQSFAGRPVVQADGSRAEFAVAWPAPAGGGG